MMNFPRSKSTRCSQFEDRRVSQHKPQEFRAHGGSGVASKVPMSRTDRGDRP